MKIFTAIAIFACLALASDAKSYEGYKTYRTHPRNAVQLAALKSLEVHTDIDFWTEPNMVGRPIDVMVNPAKIGYIKYFFDVNNIHHTVLIENVGSTVSNPSELLVRNIFNEVPKDGKISFTKFERYGTIQAYLKAMADANPSTVSLLNLGKTTEGRDLNGLKISTGGNKPAIFVDAGIHAREWIAPCTALYIIDQLINNPNMAGYLEKVDWYIVPVLNPDGYEYSHTTDRFWRKTRSSHQRCKGTDANRNYDFHWMETGASSNECSDTYAGPKGFSEAETLAMKNFVEKIQADTNQSIKLYLTFHSYGQYLLYPWGWTSSYPSNHAELQELAEDVNSAIEAVRGTEYTIGSSTNVLYPAAGGSDDWMKGVANVPLSYTVELPGGGSGGFNPPASAIKGIVEETFEGVKVYAKYVMDTY